MTQRKTGPGAPSRDALEAAKRASTIQLLLRCGRILNDRAIERLRAQTGLPVRAAHTSLLPHIDLEGTRLTDLAERAGVTKQAVFQLVDEMVSMGMLERVADPTDGRARKIRFSASGRRGLVEGLGVLRSLEGELADALGAKRMRGLHETLSTLSDHLDAGAPAESPPVAKRSTPAKKRSR